MALTVPSAVLSQEEAQGNIFSSEKPVKLSCGPVVFSDGTPLTMENGIAFEYVLCRRPDPATVDIWDEESKAWVPQHAPITPQPLFNRNGNWAAVLVATGQKDNTGNDKLSTDPATGYPAYFVRCSFTGKDGNGVEHTGTSPDSNEVRIISAKEKQRAGLETIPEDIGEARKILLFLKDSSLLNQSVISIEQDGSGHRIRLDASNAIISITRDGDIELTPAPGGEVIINGKVQVTGAMQVSGTVTSANIMP